MTVFGVRVVRLCVPSARHQPVFTVLFARGVHLHGTVMPEHGLSSFPMSVRKADHPVVPDEEARSQFQKPPERIQDYLYHCPFASGDLDEYVIEELVKKGAKIDAFGVGTRMSTSYDRPYVDVVYKLSGKVEHGTFVPAMKLSKGKITLPGKKQVFRQMNKKGNYVKDVIGLEHEKVGGEPLLEKVMENGQITCDMPTLEQIRAAASKNLAEFPDRCKKLTCAPVYPVELSRELSRIKNQLIRQMKNSESMA